MRLRRGVAGLLLVIGGCALAVGTLLYHIRFRETFETPPVPLPVSASASVLFLALGTAL